MNELWLPDKRIHLSPPSKAEMEAISVLGGFVEIGVWDKTGKLYYQKRELSRSPVKQFLQFILAQLRVGNIANVLDITNTNRTAGNATMPANGALGDPDKGIVIGTDATAVDITDYKLAAILTHGSTSGTMYFNATQFDSSVTVADPDATFDMWRNFNNNSGGTITIRETGIEIHQTYRYLIVRDVPVAVAVADGGGCYVKYTLKITE